MKLLRVTLTGRNVGVGISLSLFLVYFLLINSAGELLEKYFSNVDNGNGQGWISGSRYRCRAEFKFIRIIFEGEAAFYFFDNCYFEFDAIRECVCFYPIKM